MQVILVRGCGDVGSAVAHTLFSEGYKVLVHDGVRPAHARRGMAFTDALFDGLSRLAGLLAKRARDVVDARSMLGCGYAIPVFDGELADVLAVIKPAVIVDARMRKRRVPEAQTDLAPLSIGLGPNFVAGSNAHIVIETGWGDDLGSVIEQGATRALSGDPRNFGGYTRERFVYSPADGEFRSALGIGSTVEAGQAVGMLGDAMICAPMGGTLRGLSHDGALVEAGAKIVEVDPRVPSPAIYGLGERPSRIARGVLAAIRAHNA